MTREFDAKAGRPGEPQGHEPDGGDGENVGDLHGLHSELRRGCEGERHPI